MARRWKKQEITYLKRYAGIRRLAELAERFKTDDETVRAKLEELELTAKDTVLPVKPEDDPQVQLFGRALKHLHNKKWGPAIKLFERVADETDQPELASRARRYIAVCRRQAGAGDEPDTDPFLLAVYERNRGNFEEALALCSRGGRQGKDERFAYLAAAIYAATGDKQRAAELLAQAIDLNPKNRVYAFHDADFAELRVDPEHAPLFRVD